MEQLKKKINDLMIEKNVKGMSVAVTDKEKVIFAEGFGVENMEYPDIKTRPEALYKIASITKVITGLTLMCLKERGLLELDKPIKEYLPWLSFKNKEAESKMTFRHVMSHTSGLPAEYTPEGTKHEEDLIHTLKEGLPELEFASLPGDGKFLYSNWGIRIASMVMQEVTGKKYTDLAKEFIINPLKMERTTFDIHVAATYPLSLPHLDTENGGHEVMHFMQENAARHATGGLYSNIFDLSKIARLLLNDGKDDNNNVIITKASLDEMRTVHGHSAKDPSIAYGLTMYVKTFGNKILHGHTGNAPPYTSGMFVDNESGLGVVVLMNSNRNDMRTLVPELVFDTLGK